MRPILASPSAPPSAPPSGARLWVCCPSSMAPKSLSQMLPALGQIGLSFGVCIGIFVVAEQRLQVHRRRHHSPALGALVGADDAVALQGVDDPARPGVADPD